MGKSFIVFLFLVKNDNVTIVDLIYTDRTLLMSF